MSTTTSDKSSSTGLRISKTVEPDCTLPYNEWTEQYRISGRAVDPTAYDRARDMMRQWGDNTHLYKRIIAEKC